MTRCRRFLFCERVAALSIADEADKSMVSCRFVARGWDCVEFRRDKRKLSRWQNTTFVLEEECREERKCSRG